MGFCCYGECKNEIKFWVNKAAKEDDFCPSWWYGLCKVHFEKILKENEFELLELMFEDQRSRERNRDTKEGKYINWKMLLNWEALEYHGKIKVYDKAYGDIKITIALKEHRKNNLIKYKKKLGLKIE